MPQLELVRREQLAGMKWWKVLEPREQRSALIEYQNLVNAMVTHGMSRLAMGEHLAKLQEILEPKRMFVIFIKTQIRQFSVATAYRYIEAYNATRDRFPEAVLRTAIANGYELPDPEKIVGRLPPPKTEDRAKIVTYLKKVETVLKQEKTDKPAPAYEPEALLRSAFHTVSTSLGRLPNNSRTRAKWLESLVGMLLADFGMEQEMSFAPLPVPDDFRVVRGRPRLSSGEDE